jgi:hypothetical protein
VNIAKPYDFKKPELPRWLIVPSLILWISATAGLLALGVFGIYQNHLFSAGATKTQGVVEKKDDQSYFGRYGGAMYHLQYLTYSYVVAGVPYHSVEILVSSRTWHSVDLNGKIPIKYLVREPADSRIDLPTEDPISSWAPLMATLLGAVSFFALLNLNWTRYRHRTPLNSNYPSSN